MRSIVLVLFTMILFFSGCIRHSNQPIKQWVRQQTETKANIRKVMPNMMVNDVNQTIEFYKKAFGFQPVATIPDTGKYNFAVLGFGRVELMIQSRENFVEEFGLYKDAPIGGTVAFYFEVNDIVDLYDKASVNASLIKELHQTFYGKKEFSVKDNNGYILTFSEALKK